MFSAFNYFTFINYSFINCTWYICIIWRRNRKWWWWFWFREWWLNATYL